MRLLPRRILRGLRPRRMRGPTVNRRWVVWLLGVAFGVGLSFCVWIAIQPDCPTEDSCRPDYVHTWHGRIWRAVEQIP